MMKGVRTWWVWVAFALCAGVIVGAMSWQTRSVFASERDRISAERRADLQERMRLALWRMDTLGATLILEEGDGLPLDFVKARFRREASGEVGVTGGAEVPEEVRGWISETDLRVLKKEKAETKEAGFALPPEEAGRGSEKAQERASEVELKKRSAAVGNVFSQKRLPAAPSAAVPAAEIAAEVADGAAAMVSPVAEDREEVAVPVLKPVSPGRPVWIRGELFLLHADEGAGGAVRGAWVDVGVLKERLLGEIRDLLPGADLVPAVAPSGDGLALASFPLRLAAGVLPVAERGMSSPVRVSLAVGWVSVLAAIGAASVLVLGVMRLSERRASFVSAVTHELRTPLTTFRLYSEMLESEAVKPEKRGQYLRVLSREADRLSHLVENVLAFSRIERGSARASVAEGRVFGLLEPMRERFEARLVAAGLALRMPLDEAAAGRMLRVDETALEHVLFNLVDNAAKYAAKSEPPEVGISVREWKGGVEIVVEDGGPGIAEGERRRIFRAFHKSAREAAETKPGVGLGLALSRRLAREMGGELWCERAERGARFVVRLRG